MPPQQETSTTKSQTEEIRVHTSGVKTKIRSAFVPEVPADEIIPYESSPYIQKLKEFQFENTGNPYLKETIAQNLSYWETHFVQEMLSRKAKDLSLPIEELYELLLARLKELIDRCEFFIAVDEYILMTHLLPLNDRWRSQFETGSSGGELNFFWRSDFEKKAFGFPNYDSDEGEKLVVNRPIYGYFSADKNGIINYAGQHPPLNAVNHFGKVSAKVKRTVALERATQTFWDSLDESVLPSPAAFPHLASIRNIGRKINNKETYKPIDDLISGNFNLDLFLYLMDYRYTEVQYHGGLSLSDIESLHISTDNGIHPLEIKLIQSAVDDYNNEHPHSPLKLIEYKSELELGQQ